jgi:hypothetical protein
MGDLRAVDEGVNPPFGAGTLLFSKISKKVQRDFVFLHFQNPQ